jgi:hypothetical protein
MTQRSVERNTLYSALCVQRSVTTGADFAIVANSTAFCPGPSWGDPTPKGGDIVTNGLQSRAGRYTPWRERPELCAEAAERLGLVGVAFRQFDGLPFVAGDDAQGDHRLFCARTWTEITPAARPVGDRPEQGRLL